MALKSLNEGIRFIKGIGEQRARSLKKLRSPRPGSYLLFPGIIGQEENQPVAEVLRRKRLLKHMSYPSSSTGAQGP